MSSLFNLYLQGGWVMHPILLCSLVALYVMVERFLTLRRARSIPNGFLAELRNFIRKGDVQSAILYVTRYDIPVGRIVKSGLQKLHRGSARVQQAMEDQGRAEAAILDRYMGVLATMAGVAPLLGFLGTVVGIAIAFDQIAALGGKVSPDALADGISQALYTTVFGLIVGIPAFAAYNYLSGMIQGIIAELENTARETFDTIEEELPHGMPHATITQPEQRAQ
ncbi:MAG: MotA/TolQ/ExbB proton channel family protein [Chlorobi bacterium CHB2]|nr:MotA/TolQ/ExbB proton channel family protein [Chlorobi bacterium CHB2]